jgi:hypothetical protein
MSKVIDYLPELEGDEAAYIDKILSDMEQSRAERFAQAYRARRIEPQTILLTTILGFFIIAGVQRFMLRQIGMGLLYLFTGGLCLVGTIVDLVNHRSLAFDYNRDVARDLVKYI